MTEPLLSRSATGDAPGPCPHCEHVIPAGATSCPNCGAPALRGDPDDVMPAGDELDEAATRELERLLRADTAGEYEVLREIGRGGMGVVYLARDIPLGRDVAMKVLPPNLTYGKGAIGGFRREARTAAALEHPNIIPIYRVAHGGKLFWYTMKYLEGRSLADVLSERKTLPLPATITILERVADALDYAHQRHVIHRDVKPANVMLETRGHVVVTDFGIAKESAPADPLRSAVIIGTPFYMSPEQCRGDPLTGASDQYSVGVMAYQILSGRMPFDSPSVVGLLHQHVGQAPPPLEAIAPGLPPHVYAAVARAMAKDASRRFASVTAFVRALVGPTGDSTVRLPRFWSLRQRVSGAGTRVSELRRGRIVGTALSAVAVAGVLGALWWSSGGSPSALGGAGDANAASGPAVVPPAGIETGRLRLMGLMPGTRVWIDGRLRADSQLEIGAGLHELRLDVPGLGGGATVETLLVPAGGSATYRFAAAVAGSVTPPRRDARPGARRDSAGSDVAVAPGPSGVLIVQTVGGWARISVDGMFRREGTSHREGVAPGTHQVRLERDGYAALDTSVAVAVRDTVIVRLTLRRVGS